MKKILFIFTLLLSLNSLALEIDEKLTMRLLDVSKTKKTILINRGLEDGLVVGDHAKFFITTGVVARGVIVKASPTRSIWSVYRIISPTDLVKGNVANLKISSAVKLTDDKSKDINSRMARRDMGEPADINGDDQMSMSSSDEQDLGALMGNEAPMSESPRMSKTPSPSSSYKSIEVNGLLSFSGLSGTYKKENFDSDASSFSMNYLVGVEKYFPKSRGFFRNVSVKAIINGMSQETGAGANDSSSWMNMGVGAAYYFGKGPFVNNDFTFFVDGLAGIANVTLESTVVTNATSGASETTTTEGSGSFFSVGVGAKYMVWGKMGVIGKLDYFSGSSTFDIEQTNGNTFSEEITLAGPRAMMGLFYRF